MKTSYIIKSLFLGLTLTGLAACSGDVEKSDYDKAIVTPTALPTVTTGDVVVSGVAAKATIDLQIPEGVEVTREGFILSTDPAAPLADASNKFIDFSKVKSGQQTAAITGLTAGTTYYYEGSNEAAALKVNIPHTSYKWIFQVPQNEIRDNDAISEADQNPLQ